MQEQVHLEQSAVRRTDHASFFSVSKFNFGRGSERGTEGKEGRRVIERARGRGKNTSGGSSAKKRNPTICTAHDHALILHRPQEETPEVAWSQRL